MKDFLNSQLFLERLEQWRENPTDEITNQLLGEHLRPLAVHIISKAVWLSRESQDDTIQEALTRCFKALATYDPNRHSPFKYFGRICFNERIRTSKKQKREDDRGNVSLDEAMFDDSESSQRMDRYVAFNSELQDDTMEAFKEILNLSPLHKRVLTNMNEGHGLFGIKTVRKKEVAASNNISLETTNALLNEVRGFLDSSMEAEIRTLIHDDKILELKACPNANQNQYHFLQPKQLSRSTRTKKKTPADSSRTNNRLQRTGPGVASIGIEKQTTGKKPKTRVQKGRMTTSDVQLSFFAQTRKSHGSSTGRKRKKQNTQISFSRSRRMERSPDRYMWLQTTLSL